MLTVTKASLITLARKNTLGSTCMNIADAKKRLVCDRPRFSDLAAQFLCLIARAFAGLGCGRGAFIFHEDRNQRIRVMFLRKSHRSHRTGVRVLFQETAPYFRNSQMTTTAMPDTAKSAIAVGAMYPNEPSINYSNRGRERKAERLQMFILITSAMNAKQPPLLYQNVSAATC